MTKRASLDTEQFKVTLPRPQRDPLDSVIPAAPQKPIVVYQPEQYAPPREETQNISPSVEKVHPIDSAPVHQEESRLVHHRTSAPRRQKVKMGFQVFKDQAITFSQLQIEEYQRTGKKPQIGDMVRQALDDYLAKKKRAEK